MSEPTRKRRTNQNSSRRSDRGSGNSSQSRSSSSKRHRRSQSQSNQSKKPKETNPTPTESPLPTPPRPFAIWLSLVAVVVVVLIFAYFVWNHWSQNSNTTHPPTSNSQSPFQKRTPIVRDSFSEKEIAQKFSSSTDANERLKWVRNPEETKKKWQLYSQQALTGKVRGIRVIPATQPDGSDLFNFLAYMEDGTGRLICIENTPAGFRVDWDAYARYTSAPWPQILKGNLSSTEVRVMVKPVSYYAFQYRDDSLWSSYVIDTPDIEQSLYAYAKRGSLTHQILQSTLRNPKKSRKITLLLSGKSQDPSRKQFEIDRILSLNWVVTDKDFESHWLAPYYHKDDGDDHTTLPTRSFK